MYRIDFAHPNHIHFVGIGGISMSGLAEILWDRGFTVSGSDDKKSELTTMLEEKGISVFYGLSARNITPDIDLAVLTSAISEDNPEFVAIKEGNIPYLTRAELLGQLMQNYKTSIAVSGTHGKTTTTSMVSQILLDAQKDPTLSIGGIFKSIQGNIRIGGGEYFVTEACEYTNSFLSLFPTIGLILNIEEDHLDFFKDLAHIRESFHRFATLLPPDGALIINGQIEHLEEITKGLSCKVITFGLTPSCDYHPAEIHPEKDGVYSFNLCAPGFEPQVITLDIPGEHNVLNALAALAVADLLHIDRTQSASSLLHFSGTERRFEYKGSIGGVTIIDDYAHHPSEITATLTAAKDYPHKTTWCVFQPHTYSRTKDFLEDFAKALSLADKVVVADIYAARETDTLGMHSTLLQDALTKLGKECYYFPSFDEIENFLLANCINGDLLITMGAGDVHKIGENLLGK